MLFKLMKFGISFMIFIFKYLKISFNEYYSIVEILYKLLRPPFVIFVNVKS